MHETMRKKRSQLARTDYIIWIQGRRESAISAKNTTTDLEEWLEGFERYYMDDDARRSAEQSKLARRREIA